MLVLRLKVGGGNIIPLFLVEVICLPSGSVTLRGSQVCAFTCGVLLEMYVAVQPESAIA